MSCLRILWLSEHFGKKKTIQTLWLKEICPTNAETQMSTPLALGTWIQLISQDENQIQIQTQTATHYANSETRDFKR